jgi:multiple sugar transport system permease protein
MEDGRRKEVRKERPPAIARRILGHFPRLLLYLVLAAWAVVSVFTMYWMFVSSFKYLGTNFSVRDLEWFPKRPTFENYTLLFTMPGVGPNVWRWFLNSAIIGIVPTLSNLVFDTMAAYSLAKLRFPGRLFIFWVVLATMMIPMFVIYIPLYRMMYDFHWIDSYWALLFPGFAGVGGIFLLKQFLDTMPQSLVDAARVDACPEFRIFWRIIFPMAKPALTVMAIFGFVGGWNDYFWPYLVTNRQQFYTIQTGMIYLSSGMEGTQFGPVLAAASLSTIPMVAMFLAFQKYFIKGITIGALKG